MWTVQGFLGGICYGAVFCHTELPWNERVAWGIIDGMIWAIAVSLTALVAWAVQKYILRAHIT